MIGDNVECRDELKPFLDILGFKLMSSSVLETHFVETYILETDYTYCEILLFNNKKTQIDDVSINVFSNPQYKSIATVHHYHEVVKYLNTKFHSTFRKFKIEKLLNNG